MNEAPPLDLLPKEGLLVLCALCEISFAQGTYPEGQVEDEQLVEYINKFLFQLSREKLIEKIEAIQNSV